METVKSWMKKHVTGDYYIWTIVFIFTIMSIWAVYSATQTLAFKMANGNTEYYLIKHSSLIGVALFCMWLAHKVDYKYYGALSKIGLIISVPLLLYTWKYGLNINEASRWLRVPIINLAFQPSDLAKLALISSLAFKLSKLQHEVTDSFKSLMPILGWVVTICGLIGLTDLSSSAMLFTTCMVIFFIGRIPMKFFMVMVFVGSVLAGGTAMMFGQRLGTAAARLERFWDKTEVSFQAEQSYIAVAKGGVTGKGPGNSEQKNFLPHPYSDFIYAIIIEEYGMTGGVFVLLLYLGLLYRGMVTAANSDRPYGGLLSAGLSFAIVFQALINMGVVTGLLPITGLPLPMISMGGTSLLFTGISFGIILSVSRGSNDNVEHTFNSDSVLKNEPMIEVK
ncbi:FtsW/RodA/SpoVE family cell cycle protein [Aureibacter tunicatorum]|uniref:Probable peptidoglycan glycosyltransferase FtsW n=1 Tax=Aureibacter tunicatorum TaxID=866807 RepID=A0AAE4BSH3_9BACT|nr:FtsW/RodA/SpoVE family cell cycle protein [Aureibacter tunicatorum]MDR6241239.1 cell division protein FtsW [Aureibacter tunicatorum]BDD03499.1 cell division protein FtsW [Aureibacter tunicatorum]